VQSVSAHEVTIRQGVAVRVPADAVKTKQGGIGFAPTGEARVTAGVLGRVVADVAELELSTAAVVVARDVALDQAAGGLVVAGAGGSKQAPTLEGRPRSVCLFRGEKTADDAEAGIRLGRSRLHLVCRRFPRPRRDLGSPCLDTE
jgi:hypothetical protein